MSPAQEEHARLQARIMHRERPHARLDGILYDLTCMYARLSQGRPS
jgi:hypothetical protein